MKDDTGKWISPGKLIALLQEVPPEFRIYPNQVGNLSVFDEALTFVGYIDFMHEEYDRFGDDHDTTTDTP
jgi:hypothetical protein